MTTNSPDTIALMTQLLKEVTAALQEINPYRNYSLERVIYYALVKVKVDLDIGAAKPALNDTVLRELATAGIDASRAAREAEAYRMAATLLSGGLCAAAAAVALGNQGK